jgi:hypothetical protein
MTPTSITIQVGSVTWTMTSSGVTFVGSQYILQGVNHIEHQHPVFTEFSPTGFEF